MQIDAAKAAVDNKSSREEMMAKLSVDVLKHLSGKQPTRGE